MDVEPKKRRVSRKLINLFGEALFVRLQHRYERKSPLEAEKAGERLGKLHYMIDAKHRRRTLMNLSMGFPDWTDAQRLRVAKGVFQHFGRITGDFLRMSVRPLEEVTDSAEVEGYHYVEEAEAKGRGTILATGHFGNWERYGQWMVGRGKTLSVIARDANQEGVQARILAIRETAGVRVMSRGNSARESLVLLKRNETLGILFDQNSRDCYVPFFGQPCGTVVGPAVLHKRTSAVLLPSFCIWLDYGKYRMVTLPPIDFENQETDQLKVMADLNLSLESIVRQYPEQWLWMHDRWKNARREGLLVA